MSGHTNDLRKTVKLLESFRENFGKDFEKTTVNQLLTLLIIATEPGITQTSFVDRLDMNGQSVSTLILRWAKTTATRKTGPDYVENPRDPSMRTTNLPKLTAKGREFLLKVANEAWGEKDTL